MPQKPDELRHAWLQALHRDDIDELKIVYVCSKNFRDNEVETTHKVPNGDGSYREIPRSRPKLRWSCANFTTRMSFLLLYSLCHQTQPSLSGGKG